jgi:hypothetical protein
VAINNGKETIPYLSFITDVLVLFFVFIVIVRNFFYFFIKIYETHIADFINILEFLKSTLTYYELPFKQQDTLWEGP